MNDQLRELIDLTRQLDFYSASSISDLIKKMEPDFRSNWRFRKIRRFIVRERNIEYINEDKSALKDAGISKPPCWCPEKYEKFKPDLFPSPSALSTIKALRNNSWRFLKCRGILLWGDSGAGKTFIAWDQVRQWIRRNCTGLDFWDDTTHDWRYPAEVYSYTAVELKKLATDASLGREKASKEWSGLLSSDGLVFIDDLHQVKLTTAFAERLFELIENIYSGERPVILTIQIPGNRLIAKWCADDPKTVDTAKAILRRLIDHCDIVHLKQEAKK